MDLTADWVVGFTDGEGCFYVGINKHPEMSVGYQVLPEFRIVQHKRDIQILYALKRFFQAGVVRQNHEDRFELRIRKLDSLEKVVDFFQTHPLKTKKNVDFQHFSKVIRLVREGRHLTREGMIQIAKLVREMNTGEKPQAEAILKELQSTG